MYVAPLATEAKQINRGAQGAGLVSAPARHSLSITIAEVARAAILASSIAAGTLDKAGSGNGSRVGICGLQREAYQCCHEAHDEGDAAKSIPGQLVDLLGTEVADGLALGEREPLHVQALHREHPSTAHDHAPATERLVEHDHRRPWEPTRRTVHLRRHPVDSLAAVDDLATEINVVLTVQPLIEVDDVRLAGRCSRVAHHELVLVGMSLPRLQAEDVVVKLPPLVSRRLRLLQQTTPTIRGDMDVNQSLTHANADRESDVWGVLGAPGAPETLPKGGGVEAPNLLEGPPGPQGPPRPPK
jgi:hypothetical protein